MAGKITGAYATTTTHTVNTTITKTATTTSYCRQQLRFIYFNKNGDYKGDYKNKNRKKVSCNYSLTITRMK